MPSTESIFVSYNKNDLKIAEWIAWELEEAGYKVILQAWDFKGNWVLEMDNAMQTSNRTLAVLSPAYINAQYTHPEWANAFKDDPKGIGHKLITVRVEDFEPKGILGQLNYVDFVGKFEEDAKELLINRVKGLRTKPSVKPDFALKSSSPQIEHKAVLTKPVFPAAEEDQESFKTVQRIIIGWRKKYALQVAMLERYVDMLGEWRRTRPNHFNNDMSIVFNKVYELANDFNELDMSELEKAKSYGLGIHDTVFSKLALGFSFRVYSDFSEESREQSKEFHEEREALGLPSADEIPDDYSLEMLERIIRSAIALAKFDITNLPSGFLAPSIATQENDLSKYDHLFITTVNDDPRLYVSIINDKLDRIHSFAARKLTLFPVHSHLNKEGTIDLLATDFDHLYIWQNSSQQPVYQLSIPGSVKAGIIHKEENEFWAHVITSKGQLYGITRDGRLSITNSLEEKDIDKAIFSADPLNPGVWHLIVSTYSRDIKTYENGGILTGEIISHEIQWQNILPELSKLSATYQGDDDIDPSKEVKIFWLGGWGLSLTKLDGLACILALRDSAFGTVFLFNDPTTLGSLRAPLFIRGSVSEAIIASGRWLIVVRLQGSEPKSLIEVWDLRPTIAELCGEWLRDEGDIYYPAPVSEKKDSFKLVMVQQYFKKGMPDPFRLISFEWPKGEIKEINVFKNLRVKPVPK